MGFLSAMLLMLLLWPILLICTALTFILPWLSAALTVAAAILLACNGGFLALLLFARVKWKAAGWMDRDYIRSCEGWKRYGLLAVKVLLTAGVIWEAIVVITCAALLIFQPWGAVLL